MRAALTLGVVLSLSAVIGLARVDARLGPRGSPAEGQVPEARAGDYPIRPVPLRDVRVADEFWQPRLEVNRTVSLPHILRENERTGRVNNFAKAAGRMPGAFVGRRYNDTDVYKAIEAASYVLAARPDAALDTQLDGLITLVAAAQEPDGYLFTTRTIDPENPAPGAGSRRWVQLNSSHELYNAGHLYEAAVAHYQATGKRTLLEVALRNADLVARTFGPAARRDTSGHQEIELALVKLYRVTGERRYVETAKFLLDERGRPRAHEPFPPGSPFTMYNDARYRQDHAPVRDQDRAIGHAVRATYMYAGMTDVAALTTDAALAQAVDRLWRDVVSKRMYLTGGLGAHGTWEAFGDDYALPNQSAYAETCASIGGLLWYHRMFLREGDGRYLDTFERTLYNGYLSGVSLAGDTFFYENPLASDGSVERQRYFDVACCPANLARLMAQLPGLVYAVRDDAFYVSLFVGSEASATVASTPVKIAQHTRYPWDGTVTLRLEPARETEFTLLVRVPGWARGEAVPSDLYRYAGTGAPGGIGLHVNGAAVPLDVERGFARVRRSWRAGDTVELRLEMPVRRVVAHASVKDDAGRAAIERGPLVYCVEAADHDGRVGDLVLPIDAALAAEFRPTLLGGVTAVTGKGRRRGGDGAWPEQPIVAVPYFAWANRGKGEMAVWVAFRE